MRKLIAILILLVAASATVAAQDVSIAGGVSVSRDPYNVSTGFSPFGRAYPPGLWAELGVRAGRVSIEGLGDINNQNIYGRAAAKVWINSGDSAFYVAPGIEGYRRGAVSYSVPITSLLSLSYSSPVTDGANLTASAGVNFYDSLDVGFTYIFKNTTYRATSPLTGGRIYGTYSKPLLGKFRFKVGGDANYLYCASTRELNTSPVTRACRLNQSGTFSAIGRVGFEIK